MTSAPSWLPKHSICRPAPSNGFGRRSNSSVSAFLIPCEVKLYWCLRQEDRRAAPSALRPLLAYRRANARSAKNSVRVPIEIGPLFNQ